MRWSFVLLKQHSFQGLWQKLWQKEIELEFCDKKVNRKTRYHNNKKHLSIKGNDIKSFVAGNEGVIFLPDSFLTKETILASVLFLLQMTVYDGRYPETPASLFGRREQ